ncbi:MAG: alkaline phosphatase family protein [Acidobacteria bacterium]|nr:alkaline phosphatase family protein [Acidobacteriota bacterium]
MAGRATPRVLLGFLIVALACVALIWALAGRGGGNPRVILIGLDGAGWTTASPLMAAGDLPNLKALVAAGASGPIASMSPIISPRIWTTIATGKVPRKHGIFNFTYKTPGGREAPVHRGMRRCKAVWNILGDHGVKVAVVNWWVTWPVEQVNGLMVSDRLRLGTNPKYHADTLAYPPSLADRLLPLVDNSETAFERDGGAFGFPVEWLRTATLDDDLFRKMRIQFPAYFTQENAIRRIGQALQKDDWDFYAVVFRMIDVSSHSLQYQIDFEKAVAEGDAALTREFTRAIRPAWLFCDAVIGDFRRAHPDATFVVVSDHGFVYQGRLFNHGNRDDGPAPGVFVISGGAARRGASVSGASVLDVTPTILRLYGLTVAGDMDGKIVDDAFDAARLPSLSLQQPSSYDTGWKNTIDAGGADETEVMEDLRALGYIQ